MKLIGKALILPIGLAILLAGAYCWKMLLIWPPGKESWLEEGLYMMAFHAACLIALIPTIIWSCARQWRSLSGKLRIMLTLISVILLAVTVVTPEIVIKTIKY